jgi:hypothetical protein
LGFQPADFLRVLTLRVFVGANQAQCEATHDCHVLGSVAAAVSGQIVFKLDIEQPVHAFHAPVTTGCVGNPVDIESGGRDREARVESRSIRVLGAQFDLYDRLDVGEARLTRIAPFGYDPVHLGRSYISPYLDAAFLLLDNGLADDFLDRSGTEVVGDLGFEGWLVALESEQVFGLMFHDLASDRDLAADGVDRDQRSLKLTGFSQVVEEFGNRGDFIGFLGHAELSWDQSGIARVDSTALSSLGNCNVLLNGFGARCYGTDDAPVEHDGNAATEDDNFADVTFRDTEEWFARLHQARQIRGRFISRRHCLIACKVDVRAPSGRTSATRWPPASTIATL